MKKALIYLTLILFLFNSTGYYFLFELDKFLNKKEMRLAIQKDPVPFIILKLTDVERDHDFHRTDKKEIEYKSQLYDVVREITHGRSSVFICVHDSKEEGLYTGLKMVQIHKIFLALWDHSVKVTFCDPKPFNDSIDVTELIFPHTLVPLTSSFLPTWSPPPELV